MVINWRVGLGTCMSIWQFLRSLFGGLPYLFNSTNCFKRQLDQINGQSWFRIPIFTACIGCGRHVTGIPGVKKERFDEAMNVRRLCFIF